MLYHDALASFDLVTIFRSLLTGRSLEAGYILAHYTRNSILISQPLSLQLHDRRVLPGRHPQSRQLKLLMWVLLRLFGCSRGRGEGRMRGISKPATEISIGKLNVQRVQKLRSAHSDPPDTSEQRGILENGREGGGNVCYRPYTTG